ncbi:MAG: nucleotidyltransferase domain-containing protein [Patescibacteria group bacterium]|nr:nucleotidyltransferase domain-containing protein [Patescibacteria group bacterium]MCL5431612.1 nucleotidyltransferase domain-containing protein [Patescibacteria group bacterium]
MIDSHLATQIKEALAKEPQVLAAYVVGSVAAGTAGAESDFDLVLVVNSRGRFDENRAYELVRQLPFPKDLDLSVVDRASSPLFLYQIISKGEKIYGRDQAAVNDFEAFTLHNYYDTAHLREIYHQALKNKFAYAG